MGGNEYRRFVSYLYSYPGGVKDKNIGFAKVEVRDGLFKINISLKGVYTDTPETFGVYVCVDRNRQGRGSCNILHIGNIMVKNGCGHYGDLLNACDINNSGYDFTDIIGIAVAREDNRYYMMFSLWDDECLDTGKVSFLSKCYNRYELQNNEVQCEACEEIVEEEIQIVEECEMVEDEKPQVWREPAVIEEEERLEPIEDIPYTVTTELPPIPQMEELFNDCDYVDAFSDDYFYDCIEVTLEQLKRTPIGDEEIVMNSFLEHGYYNFKHILLGRVQKNEKHTEYFIGVPGMYCNRERFMASMFGFNNFKKSHRSDCSNPYFGYWYQEI